MIRITAGTSPSSHPTTKRQRTNISQRSINYQISHNHKYSTLLKYNEIPQIQLSSGLKKNKNGSSKIDTNSATANTVAKSKRLYPSFPQRFFSSRPISLKETPNNSASQPNKKLSMDEPNTLWLDVLILGGGMVGSSLAAALGKLENGSIRLSSLDYDERKRCSRGNTYSVYSEAVVQPYFMLTYHASRTSRSYLIFFCLYKLILSFSSPPLLFFSSSPLLFPSTT